MTNDKKDQRAKFEAWWRSRHGGLPEVGGVWEAWQAAWAAASPSPEEAEAARHSDTERLNWLASLPEVDARLAKNGSGYWGVTVVRERVDHLLGIGDTPRAAIDDARGVMSQPEAAGTAGGEPVLWQYRWTNPSNEPFREDECRWQEVKPRDLIQTLEQRLEELRSYRFYGKPCYEVRALCASPSSAQGEQGDA